jgi:hypothetical protein
MENGLCKLDWNLGRGNVLCGVPANVDDGADGTGGRNRHVDVSEVKRLLRAGARGVSSHRERSDMAEHAVPCEIAPFLRKCDVYKGPVETRTGSFSVALQNGSILLGKVTETRDRVYHAKFHRYITIKDVSFHLKAESGSDLFEPLSDGEDFDIAHALPGGSASGQAKFNSAASEAGGVRGVY